MLSLVLSLMLSAAAPEAAPPADPATTTIKAKKPKQICQSHTNTGSRMKRQTCKTQQEWESEQQTNVGSDARLTHGAGGGN